MGSGLWGVSGSGICGLRVPLKASESKSWGVRAFGVWWF